MYYGGEGSAPKKQCPACGKQVNQHHANDPESFCQRDKKPVTIKTSS